MISKIDYQNYYSDFLKWVQKQGFLRMTQHALVILFSFYLLNVIKNNQLKSRGNKKGFFNNLTKFGLRWARKFNYFNQKIQKKLQEQASKNIQQILKTKQIKCQFSHLPKKGMNSQQILQIIDRRIKADIDPTEGKTFAYVYQHSKAHSNLTQKCFQKYIHSNALNPIVFNSLRVIQNQVVQMAINLFNGDQNCVGNMTSCGTQSLLLAMKTYRDYRGKGKVLMSTAGHPGINKGCDYVGLQIVQVQLNQKKQMCLKDLKNKISRDTILVVASAPQYPHGVVDDIQQIGKICQKYNVPLHIDSAIGGFVLPFIQKLGKNKFGKWDFRVPAVTSINADIHKYGYSPKGASLLVYKNSKIRRNQYFTFSTWPGGIYISPTALGSRNGGCLSSAWGSLMDLGQQGFIQVVSKLVQSVQKLTNFIKNHQDLQMIAQPHSTIVAFKCKNLNSYQLADSIKTRGYYVQMQSSPACIHLSIMPQHYCLIQDIINAINQSITQIKNNKQLYVNQSKAVYGMLASIPDQTVVQDFMAHYMDNMYKFDRK